MAKTNFTKVEEAFDEGMRKVSVTRLMDITETDPSDRKKPDSGNPTAQDRVAAWKRQLLISLKHDFKYLQKIGIDPYAKLTCDKSEFKSFVANPAQVSSQDWEKLKEIKVKADVLKKEIDTKVSDEDRVQNERDKHINKRFNVNEKWLPLK